MAYANPIEAYLQAAQVRNQNRRNMYQDIASLGQGLGSTLGSVGDIIKQQKQKALMQQLVQAMKTQGSPQQGPQLPGQGMMKGMPSPASGMGGPAQDNTSQLKALLMQADPQGMMGQMEGQMFTQKPTPLDPSQVALNQAKTAALQRGPQQKLGQGGWRAIQDRDGSAYLYNESTGETKQIRGPATPPSPKPISPVPAAKLAVDVQKANNAGKFRWPWESAPPIVNPLDQGNQQNQSVPQQGGTFNGRKIISVEQVQ